MSLKMFLFLIFLFVFSLAQDEKNTTNSTILQENLPINQRVYGQILLEDPSEASQTLKYYLINITEPLADEDLIVMAKPTNRISDPDLFISSTNPYPNTYENSEIVCNAFGLDICVINASSIAQTRVFYVGVSCFQNCEFYLLAEYNSEAFLTLGQEVIIRYYDTASEIAKIFIPQNDTIDQLIIYANLMNSQQVNETFHFYVNEGDTIPSSSQYDFFSTEVWYDGKGVSITKNPSFPGTKALKTNCNYTVLVEAPANSVIVVIAEVFPLVRPIRLFQEIRDLVDYQANQTYMLTISDEELAEMKDDPLIIELRVFSGDPDLYVHFDSLPEKLQQFQWSSNETGNEALSISAYERKQVSASGKVFYITIYGKFESGYILDAYYTNKNEDFLLFGESFTGSVINDEVMNYRLNLFGSGEAWVTLELNSESGNAELFAKRCSNLDKNECKITKKNVKNNQNSSLWSSTNAYGLDTISFFFNHTECNIQIQTQQYGIVNICTYQIGVYGNSSDNSNNISHYSLIAKHSQHHMILKEDEGFRNSLEMNEKEYYKFFIGDDVNVQEVSFYVDCIAGDVTVYSSKTNRFPNSTDHEKASYFEIDFIQYLKNNSDEGNSSLVGMYYLTVEAYSLADYIITPIVRRYNVNQNQTENNNTVIKYTRLVEGQPTKRSFQSQTVRNYFKIKVAFNSSVDISSRSVLLNFKPISGDFDVYINTDGSDPSETAYNYKMTDNEILFEDIETLVFSFKVLVVVSPGEELQNYYKFELYYATSNSIIPLTYHPYYDTLSEDTIKYFVIFYDPLGPDLIVTRNIYTSAGKHVADVWVSIDPTNPYPDETYYDFNLTTDGIEMNSSSLTIKTQDLSTKCNEKPCPMFISIYAYQDILFSLVVRQRVVPLLLTDGVMSKVPLPKRNESLNFYYFVPNNATITLFVDSFYVKLKAFVNIQQLENSEKNEKNSWSYPSEFSHDFSYNTSYYSPGSIIIKSKDLMSCPKFSYGCALLITISLNEEMLSSEISLDNFDILITSEITMLKEGSPMVGYVEKHMIKYYSFQISQKNCSIIISVSAMGDGDPDLVVSKGRDSRPTLESYQWISNTYKGDVLQINQANNESMNGIYVVGVYGFTNTTFSISFISEKDSLLLIRSGFPTEINLKAGDYQYLQYYNIYGEFRVILNTNYGSGQVFINSFNNSFNFIDQMPNKTFYQWSTLTNNRDIVYVEENDKGYCQYCNYIFAIYAERDSKFQVLVSNEADPIHLQSGQPLNDYIDEGCKNHYSYQTNLETVEMNILLYAGEIEVYISNNETVSESSFSKKFTKKDFRANELDVTLGKGYSLIPYFNENSTKSDNIYRHSVLIKGVSETNYSITFMNVHEKKVLRYGVADYSSLNSSEFQEYLFYGENDQIFTLLLTVGNQAGISDFDVNFNDSYVLPNISIQYTTKNTGGELKSANIVKTLTTATSLFYKIRTVKATYHINVSNTDYHEVRYNLLVNSDDVELIIPGTETMQSLLDGDVQNYELYSPSAKKVFIEIFECLGKVQLKGTQDYLKMKNGEFDWEFEYPYENNHIIAFYEVQAGPVFIGVEAIEGFSPDENATNSKEEALYVMKTHLLPPKGKIPQEKFFAGGDGALLYKNGFLSDNKGLKVTFKPVECANKCVNETSFIPIQYVYYLHVSADRAILTSFSRCNMNDDAFAIFQLAKQGTPKLYYERYAQIYGGTEQPAKIDFEIELPEDTEGPFFINAVAEIWVYDSVNNVFEEFTIVYNPQEVYANKKYQPTEVAGVRLLWILLAGGGVFLFVAIVCCCYYMKRTKKFEKRLKYELSDIRNVAGGEIFEDKKPGDKPGENIPIHYKGFLEEKGQAEEN